jgi:hypothetical protein
MRICLLVDAGLAFASPSDVERASASPSDARRTSASLSSSDTHLHPRSPPDVHPPPKLTLVAPIRLHDAALQERVRGRSSRYIPLREGTDLRASVIVGPGARAPHDSPGPSCSVASGSWHQGGFGQAATEAEGILISCSCLY